MKILRHGLLTVLLAVLSLGAQAIGLEALSGRDASAGLKEALSQGADYAVGALGKNGGFMGNEKVRIPLPGYLEQAAAGLRMFGMGAQADQLVETMNRAAENAVAVAKPVLGNAIRQMSVQDAKAILTGGDDSVTQYFKSSSSAALTAKFLPIVQSETKRLKLAEQYNKVASKAAGAGLLDSKDADIDRYVTQKAMDGLFLMIAEEEKKLRANPLAAGSGLLKKVFGAL
ncbi:MAG: DUF4197 domain-containing protein [Dechloromonas sp.]|nr:DUF4197 domain-containing protein [Dechloromonas sp.]